MTFNNSPVTSSATDQYNAFIFTVRNSGKRGLLCLHPTDEFSMKDKTETYSHKVQDAT
jgi:hypothetical protein